MKKSKAVLLDDTAYFGLLLVLVAVSAYGLGRFTPEGQTAPAATAGVVLVESAPSTPETTVVETENQLVGSKNGSKYHYLWCPGASQIKEENKVYFDSIEAARAAGYTPAANCDGLE